MELIIRVKCADEAKKTTQATRLLTRLQLTTCHSQLQAAAKQHSTSTAISLEQLNILNNLQQ